VQALAGSIATLTGSILLAFLVVKDSRPSGPAVVTILAVAFAVSTGYWLLRQDWALPWQTHQEPGGVIVVDNVHDSVIEHSYASGTKPRLEIRDSHNVTVRLTEAKPEQARRSGTEEEQTPP
jgi:hypothetical protein